MPGTCARCGKPDPARKLYPPLEWVDYLHEERGLTRPEGVLAVPLCGDCHSRLAPLREAFREFDRLDTDSRTRTRERIESELDDLDLAVLVDETGPDPGDVGSVL